MKKDNSQKNKVYVAMSGGVDSSVAAALLKEEGYLVTGVFMRPWQPEGIKCIWKEEREDAMRAASILGIPFLTWDFSKEYKKEVADYMIREYRAGRTPNPDVMCNKEIKFGLFLKKALKEGADYIATGHYVRLKPIVSFASPKNKMNKIILETESQRKKLATNFDERANNKEIPRSLSLQEGKDKNKDQSYFLWTLKNEQIKRCIFPVGDYTKPEIRKLAKKFKLPNHDKKDSQGVCFIGQLDMKNFLQSYIKPKPGKIVLDKKIIGTHDGVYYYTIGQRHGLNISLGKGPYFVISKDIKKNIVYVGKEKELYSDRMSVGGINWINAPNKYPANLKIRIRYRSNPESALLEKNGNIKFVRPVRALTPGQSAVFYRGEEMIGGGIIKK